MPTLPNDIMRMLLPFVPVFSERVWDWASILVMGAILAPQQRTISAILRVMGLANERQFQNYHRVFNRAKWSALRVSRLFVKQLVAHLVAPDAALVFVGDETLERRYSEQIKAVGQYRDPLLSSRRTAISVKAIRWLCVALVVNVSWARRAWALPFLTLTAPSPAVSLRLKRRHRTVIDRLGQVVRVLRYWFPDRRLVMVNDGGLCAHKLGWQAVQANVVWVSRPQMNMRLFDFPASASQPRGKRQLNFHQRLTDLTTDWTTLDVLWYNAQPRQLRCATGVGLWQPDPHLPPLPMRWVLATDLGPSPSAHAIALACTDLEASPAQIIHWYIARWTIEVTFQEARAHLGFQTLRNFAARAVARTSPAILALFSLVTLLTHQLLLLAPHTTLPVRRTAWYCKPEPTFSDALAFVRLHLWQHLVASQAQSTSLLSTSPPSLLAHLMQLLANPP
jgi:DDE superfamily endonuclease